MVHADEDLLRAVRARHRVLIHDVGIEDVTVGSRLVRTDAAPARPGGRPQIAMEPLHARRQQHRCRGRGGAEEEAVALRAPDDVQCASESMGYFWSENPFLGATWHAGVARGRSGRGPAGRDYAPDPCGKRCDPSVIRARGALYPRPPRQGASPSAHPVVAVLRLAGRRACGVKLGRFGGRRARRSRVGQGQGGQARGPEGTRRTAVRIFLAMASVLMRAMRRGGAWHLAQTTSMPKVLRSSSAHGM